MASITEIENLLQAQEKCINELRDANVRLKAVNTDLLAACKEVRAVFVGLVEGSIGGQAIKKVDEAITAAEKKS